MNDRVKQLLQRVFNRSNYVLARQWLRRRVVDASLVLPRSWRLTDEERTDAIAYRDERIFVKVGRDPTLTKHVAQIKKDLPLPDRAVEAVPNGPWIEAEQALSYSGKSSAIVVGAENPPVVK